MPASSLALTARTGRRDMSGLVGTSCRTSANAPTLIDPILPCSPTSSAPLTVMISLAGRTRERIKNSRDWGRCIGPKAETAPPGFWGREMELGWIEVTSLGGKQQSWSTQFPYRSLQSQEAMRRKGLPQAFEGQFTNRFDLC